MSLAVTGEQSFMRRKMQQTKMKRGIALGFATLGVLGMTVSSVAPAYAADDVTTISWLTQSGPSAQAKAKAIIAAFEFKNPTIQVELQTTPSGADRDKLIATKLQTGTMADVFDYNSGAKLFALNPAKNVVDVTNEKFQSNVVSGFKVAVTVDKKIYGAPYETSGAGGVYYNKKAFAKAGVTSIPKTWNEFIAASQKLKASGIDAVCMTNGESWTAQLPVLADFYNVNAAIPNVADKYNANKMKFATTPAALEGFKKMEQLAKLKLVNKDNATAKYNDAATRISTGKCGMYMMGTWFTSSIAKKNINDVGFFPVPGPNAKNNGLTLWASTGMYIYSGTKNLAAAKKFQAFIASKGATDAQVAAVGYEGPFSTKDQSAAPKSIALATKDLIRLLKGKTYPALEYLSDVKGPNLEAICVQVSTGQISAKKGAELYDADVVKQAKQLGKPGF
jgi:raffinose/stachyose/melibiose transport system substrate-binding protein